MSKEILQEIGSTVRDITKEKFRYAVVISYLVVWILFNWDLLYFLFFDTSKAIFKIKYIKSEFLNYSDCMTVYYFFRNLFIAAFLTFIFPAIQILLDYSSIGLIKLDKEVEDIKSGKDVIRSYKFIREKHVKALKENEELKATLELLKNDINVATLQEEKLKKQLEQIKDKEIVEKLKNFGNDRPYSKNH